MKRKKKDCEVRVPRVSLVEFWDFVEECDFAHRSVEQVKRIVRRKADRGWLELVFEEHVRTLANLFFDGSQNDQVLNLLSYVVADGRETFMAALRMSPVEAEKLMCAVLVKYKGHAEDDTDFAYVFQRSRDRDAADLDQRLERDGPSVQYS